MWEEITQPCKGKPELTKSSVRINQDQSKFCSKFLSPGGSLTRLFSDLGTSKAVFSVLA